MKHVMSGRSSFCDIRDVTQSLASGPLHFYIAKLLPVSFVKGTVVRSVTNTLQYMMRKRQLHFILQSPTGLTSACLLTVTIGDIDSPSTAVVRMAVDPRILVVQLSVNCR